jgi:hypothetical protein
MFSQGVQLSEVISKRSDHGFVLVVWQIKLFGCVSDYFRNLFVMDMGDVRENMMFHLVIQTSRPEVDKLVVDGKV